jgi:hypothetical protein
VSIRFKFEEYDEITLSVRSARIAAMPLFAGKQGQPSQPRSHTKDGTNPTILVENLLGKDSKKTVSVVNEEDNYRTLPAISITEPRGGSVQVCPALAEPLGAPSLAGLIGQRAGSGALSSRGPRPHTPAAKRYSHGR